MIIVITILFKLLFSILNCEQILIIFPIKNSKRYLLLYIEISIFFKYKINPEILTDIVKDSCNILSLIKIIDLRFKRSKIILLMILLL